MSLSTINAQSIGKVSGIVLPVNLVMTMLNFGVGAYIVERSSSSDIDYQTALTVIQALSFCACCVSVLTYMGAGALYSHFSLQTDMPVSIGRIVLGGTLAALAVGFLTAVCRGLSSQASGLSELAFIFYYLDDVRSEADITRVIYVILGVCVWLVIAAGMGAVGSGVYALIRRGRANPSAPAV